MTKGIEKLNRTLTKFILRQQMFFVATAAPDGRVNLSPKGLDTLRVVSDRQILWLSLTGSGNETAAHLLESPRMTLMFCAFEGDAMILRIYGDARAVHPDDDDWEGVSTQFPKYAGSRQIFDLTIDRVQVSCGTGVPLMEYKGQRGGDELGPYYKDMGEAGVRDYWLRKNAVSIDGKPTGVAGSSGR
jgi:hypothetical protein